MCCGFFVCAVLAYAVCDVRRYAVRHDLVLLTRRRRRRNHQHLSKCCHCVCVVEYLALGHGRTRAHMSRRA